MKSTYVTNENTYQNPPSRHDIQRHITSNKTYDFCMFSKFANFVPIDLKIGTHIDGTYTLYEYLAKCIDQYNVTYTSMTTKYPIIKHRIFYFYK